MEFTRLSMLTGDSKWWDAVMRIYALLEEQQHDTFLSGMWPVTVNAEQADFTSDSLFTLSAMSDSLYEYFPKVCIITPGECLFQADSSVLDARSPRRSPSRRTCGG